MAAAVASSSPGHRPDDVFFSVFPKINFTIPTPESTPNIGTISSPGQPFGGFNAAAHLSDDTVRFSRAWSTATRFLTLSPAIEIKTAPADSEILASFAFLLESPAAHKDLVSWYNNEINTHFRHFVLPELQIWHESILLSKAPEILIYTAGLLRKAQEQYTGRLETIVSNADTAELRENAISFGCRIKQNLQSAVLHSLPRQRVQNVISAAMFQQLQQSLQNGSNPEKCVKDNRCHCMVDLDGSLLQQLYDIGFSGVIGERALAHAVHRFLQDCAIERRCFEVDWNGYASVVSKLKFWVSQGLLPVIERALGTLTGNSSFKFAPNDAQQFVDMAVANLGRMRTLSLFEYARTWPASTGAIMDIWEYLNAGGQSEKAHVCQSFSEQIQRRLLHAGASTAEILNVYVNVIHTFRSLDSRGVLLEKVAVPIRNYLRARDDTVSIIAASFLADVDREGNVKAAGMDKVCSDITVEVANATLEDSRDHKMLNWDDMEWMPDPIDAGPNYKSSKSEDVVAHILGLFEQEEFVKEITTVLAQHLLHTSDSEYIKETRLVELFKSRLDATKLQAPEVMLKDMRDSVTLGKRINPFAVYDQTAAVPTPRDIQAAIPEDGITLASLYSMFESRMKRPQFIAAVKLVANRRHDLFYAKRTRIPPDPAGSASKKKEGPDFKAQILSSFFWPQLRSNKFNMPQILKPLQTNFEQRFNTLGSQRKLNFRPALAQVSMRLELEDRTIEEENVSGWRASVIDVFTSLQDDESVSFTAQQLTEALNMEEELVSDALNFWTSKKVLYQREPGSYAVLERLDMDAVPKQPQAPREETISAIKSHDAMLRESAPMFSTFIANMLRNQGPKEVNGMMGITNLLKMVLPTFTYGDEEVKWLLSEMEKRGEVTKNGNVWAIAQ